MLLPLFLKTEPSQRIWTSQLDHLSETIRRHRNKVANRLGNQKLKRITLKTLRHWKATTEYHKTKDLLYVKQLLGHKSIHNTLIYTHLIEFEDNDDFVVKIANSLDEFTEFLEKGFQYVSDYEDKKILRKRK